MGTRTRERDALGTVVTFALGVLVGLVLAFPALPRGEAAPSVGGVTLDPTSTALLVAALSVVLLPLGMFTLYQLFALLDR